MIQKIALALVMVAGTARAGDMATGIIMGAMIGSAMSNSPSAAAGGPCVLYVRDMTGSVLVDSQKVYVRVRLVELGHLMGGVGVSESFGKMLDAKIDCPLWCWIQQRGESSFLLFTVYTNFPNVALVRKPKSRAGAKGGS